MADKPAVFMLCAIILIAILIGCSPENEYTLDGTEKFTYDLEDDFWEYKSDLWLQNNYTHPGENFHHREDPKMLAYKGGVMEVSFAPEESTDGKSVSAGGLQSRETFSYGLFEVSMKPPRSPGVWAHFFTYSGDTEDEIDFEFPGRDTSYVDMTLHKSGNYGYAHKRHALGFDASEGFHTYSILWLPGEIVWYVDRQEVFRAESLMLHDKTYVLMGVSAGNPAVDGMIAWVGEYQGQSGKAYYDWFRYKALAGTTAAELEKMVVLK
jgi:beta-glucanase (GH16 family)